jgi:hypothetical protein
MAWMGERGKKPHTKIENKKIKKSGKERKKKRKRYRNVIRTIGKLSSVLVLQLESLFLRVCVRCCAIDRL